MERATLTHSHGKARIAVIDDDAAVRSGISRLVRSYGLLCATVESGELALSSPAVAQADCLIMDVQLPGLDGFETRDRLHAMGLNMPTVFITAHSEMDSPEWVARMKGSPCLSKPFEESALIAAIRELLGILPG